MKVYYNRYYVVVPCCSQGCREKLGQNAISAAFCLTERVNPLEKEILLAC